MTKALRGAAAVTGGALLLAGCSADAGGASDFEVRPVLVAVPAGGSSAALMSLDAASAADQSVVDRFMAGDCSAPPQATKALAAGCTLDGSEMLLMGEVAVDSEGVAESRFSEGANGEPDELVLVFTDRGAAALEAVTREAMDTADGSGRVAMLAGGTVLSAAYVMEPITHGEVMIVGEGLWEAAGGVSTS